MTAAASIFSTWQSQTPSSGVNSLATSVLPGYIEAVLQVAVPVPSMLSFNGTDVGNGVSRVTVALALSLPLGRPPSAASNVVAVYVK